ncbi:hypothetical protein EON82_15490 [bacterium]|nr:MAG: hypothetical protein EON82_15490 [bacterium]
MARVRFSSMLDAGSGVVGNSVIARGKSGYQVRARPKPKYRPTPNQAASMARMTQASQAWNELTRAQAEAWNHFAEGITKAGFTAGQRYSPTGHNLFTAYGSKLLQLNPLATLPIWPPAERFTPDCVVLSASAGGGVPAGTVRVTSDRENTPGTVVELLVQKLKNERAAPGERYYTNAFVSFESGAMSYDLPLGAGWWALAHREVDAATGQQTGIMPFGVVEIPS